METLMSMSGSKWNFWKFAYDHGIDYKLYNIAPVETFEELENLIKEHINYAEDNFALFREEIVPRYEDSKNKYAFTWVNSKNDGSYLKYFRKCWEHQFFTFKFVNGIYCTPFILSQL
uniref:Uncharacterized protein n=1 Tax=Panagrolaimus superbus TaxID=310955 RepID=A0A914XWZ8_9BILA